MLRRETYWSSPFKSDVPREIDDVRFNCLVHAKTSARKRRRPASSLCDKSFHTITAKYLRISARSVRDATHCQGNRRSGRLDEAGLILF